MIFARERLLAISRRISAFIRGCCCIYAPFLTTDFLISCQKRQAAIARHFASPATQFIYFHFYVRHRRLAHRWRGDAD